MPVEAHNPQDRAIVTHLEAVGRLLAGLAPWLELDAVEDAGERALQARLRGQAAAAIAAITDPDSPDYATWEGHHQPLVDAAFLAHALLRAPRQLHDALDPAARARLHDRLRATRRVKPGMNNWLLFSAMIEAALARFTGDYLPEPVRFALQKHDEWYKGDGVYGDGPPFHWDYYNSYVIQPMLLDVLATLAGERSEWDELRPAAVVRAKRYAIIQERLVAPDGTFPALGRSLCYRCGAFQLLAQMALQHALPDELTPAQVRGALAAVIARTLDAPGTFDDHGWLTLGLAGHQPALAERYISTGSLYLCSTAFLPLGLPASDPFWRDPAAPWTARRVWAGEDLPADHALHEA